MTPKKRIYDFSSSHLLPIIIDKILLQPQVDDYQSLARFVRRSGLIVRVIVCASRPRIYGYPTFTVHNTFGFRCTTIRNDD